MSSSNQTAPPRKSRGRQKVSMVKMQNHSNLQVTFSKRRAGLFKKASELCTLCGAEAAILVFSPADKAYCFGHPSVKAVVDRLQGAAGTDPSPALTNPRSHVIIEAHRNSNIRDLNIELTRVESLLRAERRRAEEIERAREAGRQQGWFPTSFDGLDYEQLCVLKEAVVGFKKSVDAKVQREMLIRVANPLPNSHNHHENPSGFPVINGVGENNNNISSHFPKLSLGLGDDVSPYLDGGGVGDYSATNNGDYNYLRSNYGWSGGVVGGSNGASSSNDAHITRGGHRHGLFQMF